MLTNTPATITSADTGLAATTQTAGVWLQGGVGDSIARYTASITPSASGLAKIPSIGASAIKAHTRMLFANDAGRTSFVDVYERVDVASTYQLDMASLDTPTMTQPAVLDQTGLITWSETTDGSADWARGYFRTQRQTTLLDRVVWAPHQGSSVRLPVLPDEYAAHNPRAGDEPEVMFFMLGKGPGG